MAARPGLLINLSASRCVRCCQLGWSLFVLSAAGSVRAVQLPSDANRMLAAQDCDGGGGSIGEYRFDKFRSVWLSGCLTPRLCESVVEALVDSFELPLPTLLLVSIGFVLQGHFVCVSFHHLSCSETELDSLLVVGVASGSWRRVTFWVGGYVHALTLLQVQRSFVASVPLLRHDRATIFFLPALR
jgi:hypothetical protein